MSERRRKMREMRRNFDCFGELVMGFYAFLDAKPKPSDEAVREEYLKRLARWKRFCDGKGLPEEAKSLFTKEIAQSWRNRYTQYEITTKKETP